MQLIAGVLFAPRDTARQTRTPLSALTLSIVAVGLGWIPALLLARAFSHSLSAFDLVPAVLSVATLWLMVVPLLAFVEFGVLRLVAAPGAFTECLLGASLATVPFLLGLIPSCGCLVVPWWLTLHVVLLREYTAASWPQVLVASITTPVLVTSAIIAAGIDKLG